MWEVAEELIEGEEFADCGMGIWTGWDRVAMSPSTISGEVYSEVDGIG